MLREASLAGIFVLLLFAPAAPALPASACGSLNEAEDHVQADAGTNDDAPDDSADALRIPQDGYYWGWLSPIGRGGADRHDWYSFFVPPGTATFMANVTANYTIVYPQTFTLTMYPPDGSGPLTTTSSGGTIVLAPPTPGRYAIDLSASTVYEAGACDDAGVFPLPDAPGVAPIQNHGLYVGCNPVCLDDITT